MGKFLTLIYNWTGNYTTTIILCVSLVCLLLAPLRYWQYTTNKKKKRLMPQIKAIKDKYGLKDFGTDVDMTHDEDRPEEVRSLTSEQRILAMDEEIKQLYQKEKYIPLITWLPTVLLFVAVAWLYGEIRSSIPFDFYNDTLWQIRKDNLLTHDSSLILMFGLGWSLASAWKGLMDSAKEEDDKKKFVNIIACVVSAAFSVYIAVSLRMAIVVAYLTLQVWTELTTLAIKMLTKNGEKAEEKAEEV